MKHTTNYFVLLLAEPLISTRRTYASGPTEHKILVWRSTVQCTEEHNFKDVTLGKLRKCNAHTINRSVHAG